MCNMRLFVDAKTKLERPVIRRMKSACAQYIKPKRRASLFWLPIATTSGDMELVSCQKIGKFPFYLSYFTS